MSGDSLPWTLPVGPLALGAREVTTLYRELRQPLLRYLVCLGLSADDAQDVVHDVFLMLHRELAAGHAKENTRGWVFRVAHNLARNRQKRYEQRFAAPLGPGGDAIANDPNPEQTVLERERFRQLERALRGLTECERECLLLRAQGLRYREIGEALDMPTSTVADIVERATRKLAEQCHV